MTTPLNAAVEPLIAPALAEDLRTATHPVPLFKQAIADYKAALEARFRAGEAADVLVRERARFMDEVLTLAWQRFEWSENLGSWRKTRISLVAVGGYGRGEMHPYSDIDILILLERNNYTLHRQNVQSFTTLLWDMGLEVGHSVRRLSECRQLARADITVATAM